MNRAEYRYNYSRDILKRKVYLKKREKFISFNSYLDRANIR
jgi:hypothetical protein